MLEVNVGNELMTRDRRAAITALHDSQSVAFVGRRDAVSKAVAEIKRRIPEFVVLFTPPTSMGDGRTSMIGYRKGIDPEDFTPSRWEPRRP